MINNYIMIDGPDGCGKTTLIEQLKKDYPHFIYVKEPGDERFELSTLIRQTFLHGEALDDATRLHLMIADRLHLQRYIKEQLQLGKTVISDRCFVSTLAYQRNLNEGINTKTILAMHKLYLEQCAPKAIVLLTIDPEIREARLKARHCEPDNIEQKDKAFFEDVALLYRMAKTNLATNGYKMLSDKVHYLDANQHASRVYQHFIDTFL